MDKLFLKFIEQLNSSVVVLIVILVICFILVYRMGSWTEKFQNLYKELEIIKKISDMVIELRTKVDLIYQYTNPRTLYKSTSPISLTENGITLSKEIGAEAIFDKYKEKLKKEVNTKKPKNAYDIQQTSIEVVKNKFEQLLDEREILLLKETAFSKGYLVEDITYIFAILLRNNLLHEMKIPFAEIDKHDPQKSQ